MMTEADFIEINLRPTGTSRREIVVISDGTIVYRATFKELTIRDKSWSLEMVGKEKKGE